MPRSSQPDSDSRTATAPGRPRLLRKPPSRPRPDSDDIEQVTATRAEQHRDVHQRGSGLEEVRTPPGPPAGPLPPGSTQGRPVAVGDRRRHRRPSPQRSRNPLQAQPLLPLGNSPDLTDPPGSEACDTAGQAVARPIAAAPPGRTTTAPPGDVETEAELVRDDRSTAHSRAVAWFTAMTHVSPSDNTEVPSPLLGRATPRASRESRLLPQPRAARPAIRTGDRMT